MTAMFTQRLAGYHMGAPLRKRQNQSGFYWKWLILPLYSTIDLFLFAKFSSKKSKIY